MRHQVLVVTGVLTILVIRYFSFIEYSGDPLLKQFVQKNIEAVGVVVTEPDERESSVRFVVQLEKVFEEEGKDKKKGEQNIEPTKIIFSDSAYSRIRYGDRVRIKGVLKEPENFMTDTGREFNYRMYLKKDKILYQMSYAGVEAIAARNGNPIKHILFDIKNSFIEKLDQTLSFPESRLAAGLVVAGKKSLPKTIQDEFQKTGTLQVVVLSGYNVTIVAEMLMGLLRTVSYRLSSSVGITGIILFVVMAGGSATIVRGGIMAIMIIVAKSSRRRYGVTRALVVTGVLMLLYNPLYLFYDPSFQLSFLATAGLIYVSPLIERRLTWISERFGLRGIVAATLGAQFAVTPLLLYSTGELSLVALPANILISFIVPLTMLFCFITGMLGYISWFVAFPVSLIAFCLLTIILQTVHIFSSFPFASIALPYFPLSVVYLIYISSSVLLIKFYNRETFTVVKPS